MQTSHGGLGGRGVLLVYVTQTLGLYNLSVDRLGIVAQGMTTLVLTDSQPRVSGPRAAPHRCQV